MINGKGECIVGMFWCIIGGFEYQSFNIKVLISNIEQGMSNIENT